MNPIARRLDGSAIVRSPDIRGVVHLIDGDRVLCGTSIAIVYDEAVVRPMDQHCRACVHALRDLHEGEARPGATS